MAEPQFSDDIYRNLKVHYVLKGENQQYLYGQFENVKNVTFFIF